MKRHRVGPLELEIFHTLFSSIAEEMGVLLQRSAFSPNIKERRDFSCALFSSRGELVSQAAHIPVHLGSAPLSVRAAMQEHEFRPGDSVLLNDPYRGGTHLPDLTLVSPLFLERARPSFFVATRAHHADVGGAHPGSMASCRDIFGEGIRIPPVVLQRQGKFERDVLRMLLANVRTPKEREADLRAQCAANDRGLERMRELTQRYGRDLLEAAAEELLDDGERRMKSLLARLPQGTWSFRDVLDDDGEGGTDIEIHAAIRLRRTSAEVDFTGTSAQVPGSLNANPAIALSAVMYVFQCLMEQERPPNEGMMRPIRLVLPKGSLLNPFEGAAVAAGNVETSQRIVDVVMGALARALPGRVPAASQGTMNNLTIGSAGGEAAFSYYETTGGGAGASQDADGASGIQVHMTNTLNTPIEALEISYPLRVVKASIQRGSGGRGARRGGDGIVREIEVLQSAQISVLSERRRHPPFGLCGGEPGSKGKNWVVKRGQRLSRPGKYVDDLSTGDRVGFVTPGGGGYGATRARSKGKQS